MSSYSYNLNFGDIINPVKKAHFGANFREMSHNIGDAFDMLGVTHFRYPAGATQKVNLTHMENGELSQDFQEFLTWVKERDTPFTLSVPVGELLATQTQMVEFANAVYGKLGASSHLLKAFEISNEYWSFQTADEYDRDATIAISYLKFAIDNVNETQDGYNVDPALLVQTAPPWQREGLTTNQKNREIISHFDANNDLSDGLQVTLASEALDGIVSHYYYAKGPEGDNTFSDECREHREIDTRVDMWVEYFEKDLDYHITEWNVQNARIDQQGLKAASVILKQFENMLKAGADAADVWSVCNKNYNSLVGGTLEEYPIHPTPAGQVFMWMGESLFDEDGDGLPLVSVNGVPSNNRPIEFNAFAGEEKTVVYVSNRTDEFNVTVELDLAEVVDYVPHVSVTKMGILEGSADGLSDRAVFYDDGSFVYGSRNKLRVIDEQEKIAIEVKFSNIIKLGIYDRHWIGKYGEDNYRTYIPEPSTILLKPGKSPKTATSLDDYYFSTEVDITVDIDQFFFEDSSNVQLEFDSYEVVEIVLQPLSKFGTSVPSLAGEFNFSSDTANPNLRFADMLITPEDGEEYSVKADKDGKFELESLDEDEKFQVEFALSYNTDNTTIDARDALQALRLAVGLDLTWGEADPENLIAADFNRDGKITALDALNILQTAIAYPEQNTHEWVFFEADQDMSDLSKDNVYYETKFSVQAEGNLMDLSLTSLLLGNIEEF